MTGTDPVHLRTGEPLDRLDEQPPDVLAEALHLVLEREAEAKRWRDALEGELRRRLKIRQTRFATFGDWEVEASVSRESVWDADELEAAMRQLADEGVIRAGDFSDVITRPPVVSRSNAKALLAHLDGEARERVAAACSWKEKPGKLTVARSVDLAAALEPADGGDGRPPEAGLSLDFRRERQGAVSAPEPAPAPPPTLTPEELFA